MYSVAICTFERPELTISLVSHLASRVHENAEILVVDNSIGKEAYSLIVESVSDRRVTLERSAPPGLSRARNRALDSAKYDVVAFLDDDAKPHESWFKSLLQLTKQEFCLAGGPVFPEWPVTGRPHWLPESLLGAYSVLDLGSKARQLRSHEYALGANMVIHRDAISDLRFSTDLGRVGHSLISGEEVAFQDQLADLGAERIYVPGLAVNHAVPHERVSQAWLRRRMFAQGFSEGRAQLENPKSWAPSLAEALHNEHQSLTVASLFANASGSVEFLRQANILRALAAHSVTSGDSVSSRSQSPSHRAIGAHSHLQSSLPRRKHLLPPTYQSTIRVIDHDRVHGYLFTPLIGREFGVSLLPSDPWPADYRSAEEDWRLVQKIAEADPTTQVVLGSLDQFAYRTEIGELRAWRRSIRNWRAGFVHRILDDPRYLDKLRYLAEEGISILTLSKRIAATLQRNGVSAIPIMHPLTPQAIAMRTIMTRGGIPRDRDEGRELRLGIVGELRNPGAISVAASIITEMESFQRLVLVPIGGATADTLRRLDKVSRAVPTDDQFMRSRTAQSYRALTDDQLLQGVSSLDVALVVRSRSDVECASATLPLLVAAEIPIITDSDSEVADVVLNCGLGVPWRVLRVQPIGIQRRVLAETPSGTAAYLDEASPSNFASRLRNALAQLSISQRPPVAGDHSGRG